MRDNDSDLNDIVEAIVQKEGCHLASKQEEETIENFTNVWKPGVRVAFNVDKQKLLGPESHSKRADKYVDEEKMEDTMSK